MHFNQFQLIVNCILLDLTMNYREKKRIAFAWFDLVKLLQDPSYPDHLASQLGFFDSAKLLEILKDCTDILCVERGGIKDYSNKRKRHITPDDLIALPSLSKRIKRLCQDNSIEWCVRSPFKIKERRCILLYLSSRGWTFFVRPVGGAR